MFSKITLVVLMSSVLVSSAYAAEEVDNSAKNKKQVENGELDACDQGTSIADIELTRKIRQEVVNDKAFSTNAKNVKIITIGGKVTLKGPVKTMEEKKSIGILATKVAGKGHVNNEIEIEKN